MSRDDWYRNKHWDSAIASAFAQKLGRSRRKSQYVRIQASYLTRSHPRVALELFDQYFALDDRFDDAIAYVERAEALLALGRLDEALAAYEAALAQEAAKPNSLTEASFLFPLLIASRGIEARFDQALRLLDAPTVRTMFAVDHFRAHASRALIARARGQAEAAVAHAREALAAAGITHSGFRYHPGVGLVGERYESLCQQLVAIAG